MTTLKIILLFLYPFALAAQTKIVNRSLQNKDTAILYVGLRNNLQIISSIETNTLQLRINRKLVKQTDSFFVYTPSVAGFDTIQVFKGPKLLTTTIFKVDVVNGPEVFIANTTVKTITKNQLLVNPFVTVRISNCYLAIQYQVLSFRCLINNRYFEGTAGGYLTNEMIIEINKLNSGDTIQFEEIRATLLPGYRPVVLPPQTIKVG